MTHELPHPYENARLGALHTLQILDTPIEERFERITRLASRAFNVPVCAISYIDEHDIWFKSIQGLNACKADREITLCQHAILGNGPLVINDTRFDDRFTANPLSFGDISAVFYAGIPIRSIDGLPVATFCMIDTKPRLFDNDDFEMLEDFAKMIQHEIHTAGPNRVQDEVIQKASSSWRISMIDPLTRLWNHDGIITTLDESLSQSRDSNANMCIIMIDLTQFDHINTQLGHVAGDKILRQFSRALLREIGDEHIIGRLYNDKFAILINTITDLSNACELLERVQKFVDSYPIEGMKERTSLGGALAGVLVMGDYPITPESVFEHLDESIYIAKHSDEYQLIVIKNPDDNQQAA